MGLGNLTEWEFVLSDSRASLFIDSFRQEKSRFGGGFGVSQHILTGKAGGFTEAGVEPYTTFCQDLLTDPNGIKLRGKLDEKEWLI